MITLPKTKAEAIRVGASYFQTERPCRYGHTCPRYAKGGGCVQCARNTSAKRRGVDPEKVVPGPVRAAMRQAATGATYEPAAPCKHGHRLRWTGTNNCVECSNTVQKRHKISAKYSRIKKEYGISKETYLSLLAKSNGSCCICENKPESNFSLHVDHCHRTGAVRGLLCQKCNQAIGLLNDDTKLIAKALEYVLSCN